MAVSRLGAKVVVVTLRLAGIGLGGVGKGHLVRPNGRGASQQGPIAKGVSAVQRIVDAQPFAP